MIMRKVRFAPFWCLLLLFGCSDTTPSPTAKKEEKLEPVTGQSALYRMYTSARSWAPDAQVLKLNSMILTEVPDVQRGKAAAWEATFTSANRSQARRYTFSIVESEGNLHKGVFGGQEEGWTGSRGTESPFLMAATKIDTDAAYQTALEKVGDYDKKNPGKPISFLLEKTSKFPDPVWRVIWGESASRSNMSIIIDASTGEYKEKLH